MIKRLLSLLSITVVMLVSLSACVSTGTTSVDLPLANNKPTFLFFFTDN